jgi:hypothetical protein
MTDAAKTKEQLINELKIIRKRNAELEEAEIKRKRAFEIIENRNEGQQLLVDSIPDLLFALDLDGRIQLLNRMVLQCLGYTQEQLLGKKVTEIHPSDRSEEVASIVSEIIAGKRNMYSIPLLAKEGTHIPVETRVALARWADRDLLFCISFDITDRQRREAALKEGEKRYKDLYRAVRLMCDNVPDLIWAKDLNKRFVFVNEATCRKLLNAEDTDEPIGKTDMYFADRERKSHPDDPAWHTFGEICRDSDSVVMKSKKPERFDESGNVKGEYLCLDVYKAPVWNEHGEMVGTVGCGREVTRERKVEEELKKGERRYRAIVEDQTELICRFLPDGTLTFVNEAYCCYFDKKQEDLIGHNFMPFIPEEDHNVIHRQVASISFKNPVVEYIHRVILSGGRIRWMNWIDRAIFDDKHQIIEFQSVGRDITERKEMERELQEAKNGLEQQVKKRTTELSLKNKQMLREIEERKRAKKNLQDAFSNLQMTHEKLKQAQLKLVQAAKMESVGILAAGVAHEVRNPLTTIQMGVEYLSNHLSSENRHSKVTLGDMRDAVYRADSIIRGLLDFSSINEIDFEENQLNDIILKSINLVQHELYRKGIRLEEKLSRDLPGISLNSDKICQVFVNIFLNAIHALPEGGMLKVKTYERRITTKDHFGNYEGNEHFQIGEKVVMAEVEDTGKGIPEEHIMKIFDPFFTTKPTGEGTGLGLTVSRKIVESHGGMIDIINRKEGGVRITILFKE